MKALKFLGNRVEDAANAFLMKNITLNFSKRQWVWINPLKV